MTQILGVLEAFDRHGALQARTPFTQWPVTVGRSLDCDLVLDDPFIAPTHLRIDRQIDAPRAVSAKLHKTRNGATLNRKHYASGERFDWPEGMPLEIGRSSLSLRLADTAIVGELALPQGSWRTLATTVTLVALMVAAVLGESWLTANNLSKYLKSLPGVLAGAIFLLGGWSSLWAVANKMFGGRMQFWLHVRIACSIYLVAQALDLAIDLTAFAFSLETLTRFGYVLLLLVLAGGIYAHLVAILPRRRVGLAWTVAAVMVLGNAALFGSLWLSQMRLSKTLYMSSLFPPSLRVAPTVPISQFLQETEALRGKLDRRLRDDGHGDDEE